MCSSRKLNFKDEGSSAGLSTRKLAMACPLIAFCETYVMSNSDSIMSHRAVLLMVLSFLNRYLMGFILDIRNTLYDRK